MEGENREPYFTLSIQKNGEAQEVIGNRDNTELYRHLGTLGLSQFDHVYTNIEDEEESKCVRIWRHNDQYVEVEKYLEHFKFVIHDNLRKVNPADIEAYDDMISRQANDLDHIPESWGE